MCYYVSSKMSPEEIYELEQEFGIAYQDEMPDLFHVVSGFAYPPLPGITAEGRFGLLRWGLIPSWVKDFDAASKLRGSTLNAISEEVESKPSFRGAVRAGRTCIIPVAGYYEWHWHKNKNKYPHFIYPASGKFFYLAGLYEYWTNHATGDHFRTFTILTTSANERMEWIHNSKKRMPVILDRENVEEWLNPGRAFEMKKPLLKPYPVSKMKDHSISKLISSRKENFNSPEVYAPFEYPELKD